MRRYDIDYIPTKGEHITENQYGRFVLYLDVANIIEENETLKLKLEQITEEKNKSKKINDSFVILLEKLAERMEEDGELELFDND